MRRPGSRTGGVLPLLAAAGAGAAAAYWLGAGPWSAAAIGAAVGVALTLALGPTRP